MLKHALPNVLLYLKNGINSVNDLVANAEVLGKMTHVLPDALHQAKSVMGLERAAFAISITLEKHSRGLVKSPGGYVRAITEREKRQELYLERSLYGLLKHPE